MSHRRASIVAILVSLVFVAQPWGSRADATTDALQNRVLSELKVFTDWLDANSASGYIGEVGWPSDYVFDTTSDGFRNTGEHAKWNALAEAWYQAADAANLWVTAFSGGESWPAHYPLAGYWSSTSSFEQPTAIDTADTQSQVVEAHPDYVNFTGGFGFELVRRGVHDIGGAFCAPDQEDFGKRSPTNYFSNHTPYVYQGGRHKYSAKFGENSCYHYDSSQTLSFLSQRGINLVRLDVRWEHLQHALNHALSASDVQHLLDYIRAANGLGVTVIVDIHNYAHLYKWNASLRRGVRTAIGSRDLPISSYADFWRRLSTALKGEPNVMYDLMNEPEELGRHGAKVWEHASQAALNAIRANEDDHMVMVEGYNFAGVESWTQNHPVGWINDPSGNFRYEAHQYFDREDSGYYSHTYDEEVADSQARGY